jgi:hypothetical protein
MRRRRAVAGKSWNGIGAPDAMEFEAWEEGEGDRFDGGVFGNDGFAGGVATGDYAADVHGGSLLVVDRSACTECKKMPDVPPREVSRARFQQTFASQLYR